MKFDIFFVFVKFRQKVSQIIKYIYNDSTKIHLVSKFLSNSRTVLFSFRFTFVTTKSKNSAYFRIILLIKIYKNKK